MTERKTLSSYLADDVIGGGGKHFSGQIRVGDVVWLKYGGHKMTVTDIADAGVVCAWSDGRRVAKATLPVAAVMKTDPAVIQLIMHNCACPTPHCET
jgi:uncharacterized protein YodC (DUF2158 family)